MKPTTARTKSEVNLRRWPVIPPVLDEKSNTLLRTPENEVVRVFDELDHTDERRIWKYIVLPQGAWLGRQRFPNN